MELGRHGRWGKILPGIITLLAFGVASGSVPAGATVLTVDQIVGNSPYTVSANLAYDYESVGVSAQGGVMDQSAFTNTLNSAHKSALNVGFTEGASGAYNLSGTGVLQVAGQNILQASEIVGAGGATGTFNQSGGTNYMPGATLYVGTGFLGLGATTTGTYNLSGDGVIDSTRVGEATGAEVIGDSGAHGTFNQTGGTNACNNGVFIGSNVAWRYLNHSMPGAVGVYNLSGGILDTGGNGITINGESGDGGEVVGDAGGTATFNQSGGQNIATDGGLAVGSDIYGAEVGGVGVFNLGGGTLTASPLPEAVLKTQPIGGEVIGTCLGIGTFNQTGGTNTVQVGLFVGSQVTYPLAPTKDIAPGTGTYNLSGGSLTASGTVAVGSSVLVPGEDIGDAGSTGTFNQTGGVNTVTNGLFLGTDLFDKISLGKAGTGTYNLSGG
ncbi:MAG: hypothetical protein ACP5SH_08410, partial [Syntrophobacteraceae bacterium]